MPAIVTLLLPFPEVVNFILDLTGYTVDKLANHIWNISKLLAA